VKKIDYQLENGSLWREKIANEVLEAVQFVTFLDANFMKTPGPHYGMDSNTTQSQTRRHLFCRVCMNTTHCDL
jgi:hypothetical protein